MPPYTARATTERQTMNILKAIIGSVTAALIMLAGAGCCKDNAVNENRKVLLFYECGFNNLGACLESNMDNQRAGLAGGYIPKWGGDVLLVYSRIPKSYYDSDGRKPKPVESYLRRIYKSRKGKIISDTLKTFDSYIMAADPSTMRKVLSFVKEKFPAKGYGMVFSSHGSGWLPAGYYYAPDKFERDHKYVTKGSASRVAPQRMTHRLSVPEGNLADTDPFYGMVRSIGQDYIHNKRDKEYDQEMSVSEFAGAIPYHLDYILFDMCFTAGVEVVYGLKDKVDYLGLSPAEVLADGMFDYTKITSFLIGRTTPDFKGLFEDSFEMYNKKANSSERSATVNVIRTDGVDKLASVCKRLVNEYSEAIANAPTYDIQGYFRSGRHYFYDLADIFKKCGASEKDLKDLDDAIDNCVIYKNATPRLLGSVDIETYSGFSMYLPCAGTPLLDSYYKKEAWNDAVGLVE